MKLQHFTRCALSLLAAACSDDAQMAGPVENEDVTDPIQADGGAEPHVDADVDAGKEPVETETDAAAPEPNLDLVFSIFEKHCSVCHIQVDLGNLQFTTPREAHRALVNAYASNLCGDEDRVMVVPGDPDASLLVQKIEHKQDCGTPMPPHEDDRLSASEIKTIRAWIKAGAKL